VTQMASAVFVDRDGVINKKLTEGRYVTSIEEFEFLPGSLDALAQLASYGQTVVVVTNQQGVGKGLLSVDDLASIHAFMTDKVASAGGFISQICACPHLAGTCECRKPMVGLFEQAQERDQSIVFEQSVVIGDSSCDIEAGERIGARTMLVGSTSLIDGSGSRDPDARDLYEAVGMLIGG